MRLSAEQARDRFAEARVARLATRSAAGQPHVVPIVFALDADVLYWAVDAKPKTTTALKRLANIAADPRVSALVDHYSDDWTRLWWARADGPAHVLDNPAQARDLLSARYAQYATTAPTGPFVAVEVQRWTGWSAS